MPKQLLENEKDVSSILATIFKGGSEAVFDIGRYRITIAPKLARRSAVRPKEDERLWKQIEPALRSTRSAHTKKKYPWLYA